MSTKHSKSKSKHPGKSHHQTKKNLHEDKVEAEQAAPEVEADHSQDEGPFEAHAMDEEEQEVKLDFPYAGLVRAYAPKAMDVADKVATDWKKDGSFMNLGIDNTYANMAVSMGLKKAKEIEKKLDEKGVLSVVRMGVEVIKQQVNKKK